MSRAIFLSGVLHEQGKGKYRDINSPNDRPLSIQELFHVRHSSGIFSNFCNDALRGL